jgi:hypothetical protein
MIGPKAQMKTSAEARRGKLFVISHRSGCVWHNLDAAIGHRHADAHQSQEAEAGSGGLCGIRLQQLVIEDAPCLERLLYFGRTEMNISVISAPRLAILGKLFDGFPRLRFGATVFQVRTRYTYASSFSPS